MDRYYNINNKYLAEAMAFLGFRYYKINKEEGVMYSFENTKIFRENLSQILEMKHKSPKRYYKI